MNYEDHQWMLDQLKAAQEADHDLRENAREAALFVAKRDGQWEPNWWEAAKNRPRYVFDLVSPVIDQVIGDIKKSNFSVNIEPMSGEADEDTAETYDGLIRSIHNLCNGERVYNSATEGCVRSGFDAVRLTQEYVDGDSFDQDLVIKHIPNALDRVWFGPHNQPTAEDAPYCWVLSGLDKEAYKARYPDRKEASVSTDKSSNPYFNRNDLVMVGEFLYLKTKVQELCLLSDGSVVTREELKDVEDELAEAGITIEETRKREKKCVYSRLFDADGWIGEARLTVFEHRVPVVPIYGDFAFIEDKVTYRGAIERLMDPQRVFNYSLSREIEEGALAPRAKYWMTETQAEGHKEELESLNINADPVQFYNPDPQAPGAPQQQGGAQVNPGLRTISEAMRQLVGVSAGMFAANMGDNPDVQSGVAIEALQDRGDRGNSKYLDARITMQEAVAEIMVDAIPRIYTPKRQIRVLGEDGSRDTVTVGQLVMDQETGAAKVINDLSKGKYSVRCESSPSYETRQSETVKAIVEVGKIDPTAVQMGSDILFKNIPSPGMDDIAERKRQQLFAQGLIPQTQMTDQELQQLQAQQNQPPQEDPNMVLARAEEAKAQADFAKVQQDAQESQQAHEIKMAELRLREVELSIRQYEAQVKGAEAGVSIKLKGAQAAKTLAEAEAQDVETDAVVSGITSLMENRGG